MQIISIKSYEKSCDRENYKVIVKIHQRTTNKQTKYGKYSDRSPQNTNSRWNLVNKTKKHRPNEHCAWASSKSVETQRLAATSRDDDGHGTSNLVS